MQGHKELIVWQKAMQLVVAAYKLTRVFPKPRSMGWQAKYKGQRCRFL